MQGDEALMGEIWDSLKHKHSWGPWVLDPHGEYEKRQCTGERCSYTDRRKLKRPRREDGRLW